MRTLALILALTCSTQALAETAHYAGRWAQDGQCNYDGRSDEPWKVLKVEPNGFTGYEYACRFTKVTPTDISDQWTVQGDCTNEGDSYKDVFTLETTTNGLVLMVIRPDGIVTYQRCDGDV